MIHFISPHFRVSMCGNVAVDLAIQAVYALI